MVIALCKLCGCIKNIAIVSQKSIPTTLLTPMNTMTSSKLTTLSHADLLARVPLFSSLTPVQLAALAANTHKRRYKRGEVIVTQGETSKALYVLMVGRASVVARDSKGKEIILASIQQGDYLGEMSVLDGMPHSADVVADVQTDVLMLGRSELLNCLKDSPAASINLMRDLVGRLRRADEKIESLALMDVYGRVARALLDMATANADGTWSIKTKVSKQMLAKTIGASREMVTKVFKTLEAKSVILPHADGSLRIQDRSHQFFNSFS
jgi:CRP/FNR family transcriptional regulator, cyclic AMP receptor protein